MTLAELFEDTEQEQNKVSLKYLQRYTDALMLGNPGVNQMQAKTMVYWALATYYDDFDPKPILIILHSFGCGKTDLLTTLFPMVKGGKLIGGSSNAVFRDELAECKTAFLDEWEDESLLPEGLLTRRFKKTNSKISINRAIINGSGFNKEDLDINGWTAVARRKRFSSVALMSRCLIIEPKFVPNPNAKVTDVGSLQGIVDHLGEIEEIQSEGRANQIWRPLVAIAQKFNDTEWIDYARTNLSSDFEEQSLSRQYEPDEAVSGALEICQNNSNTVRLHDHWIKISDIKKTANAEYEMNLKPDQVATMLHRQGHKVSKVDGYPVVRVD